MNSQSNEFVVSYLTLRQMVGWAGLLMPITVRLGALIFEGIYSTDSISAYYYTGMRDCVRIHPGLGRRPAHLLSHSSVARQRTSNSCRNVGDWSWSVSNVSRLCD